MSFLKGFIERFASKKLMEDYRRLKKECLKLDYELIYKAYSRYTLSIIDEPRRELEFNVFEQPEVSIVIPVYNQYKHTMRCLQSILDYTDDVSYEIIIGDDNSTDETRDILTHVKNIKVVKNTGSKGFLTNCNTAAKEACGQYIYLLNNDTQLFPKTISSLVKVLEQDPQVAIVGSKCVFPDSKIQAAGILLGKYTYHLGEYENPLDPEFNHFRFVDACVGASLMVRRSFWLEENGFDEIYAPGYYEELDLCMRAKTRGFKVAYQPKSELIHFHRVSFGSKKKELAKANSKKFYEQWKY